MYADLPDRLKQVVKEYLLADDFRTAKQIHDHWMAEHRYRNDFPREWQARSETY